MIHFIAKASRMLLWILPCLLHLTVSWPVNEFFYLESQGGGSAHGKVMFQWMQVRFCDFFQMLTLSSGELKVMARSGSDSQLWQLDFETGCFRSKTSDKVGFHLYAELSFPDLPDCHGTR